MRTSYLRFRKTRNEKIKGLLNEPGNYSPRKDEMDVDIVIFGHTHQADSCLYEQILFAWDDIPEEKCNGRFKKYLINRFGLYWINDAKIKEIVKGKTIKAFTEKNSLILTLNDEKTRVSLEIDDGRTYDFISKIEKSKLKIYAKKLFINVGGWVKEGDDRDVNTFAYINDDGVFLLKWDGINKISILSHYGKDNLGLSY